MSMTKRPFNKRKEAQAHDLVERLPPIHAFYRTILPNTRIYTTQEKNHFPPFCFIYHSATTTTTSSCSSSRNVAKFLLHFLVRHFLDCYPETDTHTLPIRGSHGISLRGPFMTDLRVMNGADRFLPRFGIYVWHPPYNYSCVRQRRNQRYLCSLVVTASYSRHS